MSKDAKQILAETKAEISELESRLSQARQVEAALRGKNRRPKKAKADSK